MTAETAVKPRRRRAWHYEPHPASDGCACCGTLLVTRGSRWIARYTVTEVPAADPGAGRAFRLRRPTGTTYTLFLGWDGAACDCPDYGPGAGGSFGCDHADAIAGAVMAGLVPDSLGRFAKYLAGQPETIAEGE